MDDNMTPFTELAVSLARMEGKIDAYSARTSAVETKVDDIDVRLRAQENKSVVTPAGLFASLTLVVGAVGAAAAYIK